MQRFYSLLLLLFMQSSCALAQDYLPSSSGEVIEHNYYTLSYIEQHEQPEWVYYSVSPESLTRAASRSDNFREDPKVSTGSATLKDYSGSGYDRGHLCPAASMSGSKTAMSESFYLSNMSPQHPSFNRGIWKKLEEQVRELALRDSIIHVVTGPIFSDPIGTIGDSEVTIPRYYYKVLYSPKKGEMIGYVMENCKLTEPIESYAHSIDYVEELSGIDFFADIDDDLDQQEATANISSWVVDTTAPMTPVAKSKADDHSTSNDNSADNRCQGTTSSGAQCKRTAQSGSRYCWQHQH